MADNSKLIVAALVETDPMLAGDIDAQSSWAAEIAEAGARVALYRQYEEGEHRSGITDQMRRMLRLKAEASGLDDFNDNYCSIIIDKMAGRLYANQITTKNDTIDKQWLSPLLERTDWEALQGKVYRGAIRDGDSYVMIDPATLQWIAEPAYDGYVGVVAINEQNSKTPSWACKLWAESAASDTGKSIIHLIVYQPSRISYWKGEEGGEEIEAENNISVAMTDMGNGFSEVSEEPMFTNGQAWTLGKTPLVHFANKTDNYSNNGKSEIRVAIPLQDALNRTLHSMVMASEFSAFRIKWSIGMEINAEDITPGAVVNLVLRDRDGNIITDLDEATAEFLKAVRVGQFEETDMAQYIQQIDKLARELSQVSQTPIYGVTTEGVLSGEALKQLEIGLLGKVERFQRDNADAIRELVLLTSQMQNTFDTKLGNAPEITTVSVTWKPAELLDVNVQITTLSTMRKSLPGLFTDDFYRKRIGALLGMSNDDIEKEGQKATQEAQLTLETLVGGGTGNTVPVV